MAKSVNLRKAAVKYYQEGHTYMDTGKVFNVSYGTVYLWVKKFRETGDLSNKPLNRGVKKIDPEKLRTYVKERPDATR